MTPIKTVASLALALAILILNYPLAGADDAVDYKMTFLAIAREIEGLKAGFPQLRDFSLTQSVDLVNFVITYSFHTHRPEPRGGWTSGVPNPDADGIWFYIDFHDPASQAQIHTQPVVATVIAIGGKTAFMLDLEGAKTKPAAGRIWAIVKQHAAHPHLLKERNP
jgi:hypothetical protein